MTPAGGGDLTSIRLLFLWICLGCCVVHGSEFGFRFLSEPLWQVASPGAEVNLSCTTNLAPDEIRWQHNHRFIPDISTLATEEEEAKAWGPRISNYGPKGSGLTTTISSKRQEGLYQCVASVGSIALASLPGRIELAYLKTYPQRGRSVHDLHVAEGNAFRIPCQRPESVPEATLQFFKDGQRLDITDDKQFHITQTGDLIVLGADTFSEGHYSCRAINSLLPGVIINPSSTKVSLKSDKNSDDLPSRPPRLVTFESVITVAVGQKVEFLCASVDSFPSVLRWSHKGSGRLLTVATMGNTLLLVLDNVGVSDGGLYRCHGNNSFGSSFVDLTLFVQEPPYTIKGPESQSVSEGSIINLECIFGGNPVPTVAWVFNGNLLTSSGGVKVMDNRLELNPVERNQAGIYQCFAFNPLGNSQATCVVTVIPKTVTASPYPPVVLKPAPGYFEREIDIFLESEPEEEVKEKKKGRRVKNKKNFKRKFKKTELRREMIAPSRPNVTKISDESVMVTWDVEPGIGIPILFFKVQYRTLLSPDEAIVSRRWKTIDEDIPSHVKSYEVTGLRTNHVYRFRVLAVYVNNDNQPGRSSKKFFLEKDIRLQRPERPPQILFQLPESNTSLTLFWSYNSLTHTEGFIIYYRESTSAVEYTKITLLGAEKRNYTITHLRPGVSYDFKMNSFNMAGTSDFSPRKTYHPEGVTLSSNEEPKEEVEEEVSTVVPIVRSDPEGGVTNRLLYITLGTGLGVLFLIVIASYTFYSCRTKTPSGEDESGKFMDTSLRIHRLSVGDIRQGAPNGHCCRDVSENQAPLLAKQQNVIKNNTLQGHLPPHVPSHNSEILMNKDNRNDKVNIFRETSFTGGDQPSLDYRDISLSPTSRR